MGRHRFHEAVLEALRDPDGPYYDCLGHGEDYNFLVSVKAFRNRWLFRGSIDSGMVEKWSKLRDLVLVIENALDQAIKTAMYVVRSQLVENDDGVVEA